ncbi:hypothetical protein QTP88_025036 [Uroleucon formosanum]
MSPVRKRNNNKGSGLINSVINHLPVELHLPGYRFAGPGTKLKERLARGERGINRLDELARAHDIAYDESNSLSDRHRADEILENQAWEVFKSKNTGIKEKAASWLVTTAMKAKRKLGAGCGFKQMVSAAKKAIKNKVNDNNITKLVRTCLTAAKKSKKLKKSKSIKTPRIIPIPKKGGVLPLIPIFAGLSALDALTGGVGNIVKVVNYLNSGKNTPIHLGKGLYLTPHKGSSYKIVKALYDYEIIKYADMLKIPHFIGVFARDKLPRRAKHQELAVVNLDIETGTGTHWVAYKKIGKKVKYYDSFGSYELKEIETVIKHLLSESEDTFQLKANTNTLKCEMSSNMIIDFSIPHSICVLLGFENRIYDANVRHQSDTLMSNDSSLSMPWFSGDRVLAATPPEESPPDFFYVPERTGVIDPLPHDIIIQRLNSVRTDNGLDSRSGALLHYGTHLLDIQRCMVYQGENMLVIESKIQAGCRVLLNRSDLLRLQYLEWTIHETVVQKSTIIRPLVLKQFEIMANYLDQEFTKVDSTPKTPEEIIVFIKNLSDDKIIESNPKEDMNFISQLKMFATTQLAEQWVQRWSSEMSPKLFTEVRLISPPRYSSMSPMHEDCSQARDVEDENGHDIRNCGQRAPWNTTFENLPPSPAVDVNDGPDYFN